MPYIKKTENDELISKLEKALDNFRIHHYYKMPKENDTIQLIDDVLMTLKKKSRA